MKRSFIVLSSLFLLNAYTYGQMGKAFHVMGYIKNAKKVYLDVNGTPPINDSCIVKDGKFSFTGKVSDVESGSLMIDFENGAFSTPQIFIEPGNINVERINNDSLYKVTGTPNNDLQYKFVKSLSSELNINELRPVYDSVNNYARDEADLNRDEEHDNTEKIKILKAKSAAIAEKETLIGTIYRDNLLKEIYKAPNSYFTASALRGFAPYLSKDSLRDIIAKFPIDIRNSAIGQELKEELDKIPVAVDGSAAPLFSSKTVEGRSINLSDFKGKYVILDFWATWCAPCRASNPTLIKFYNTYHDKGLEIIGISDDDANINGWKSAIKKDGTNIWNQVLRNTNNKDINSKEVDLTKIYGVHAYPTQILIGPDGKILLRSEGGEEVENTLANILK